MTSLMSDLWILVFSVVLGGIVLGGLYMLIRFFIKRAWEN